MGFFGLEVTGLDSHIIAEIRCGGAKFNLLLATPKKNQLKLFKFQGYNKIFSDST